MARYIDADKLCEALKSMASTQYPDKQNTILGVCLAGTILDKFSTADVVPRSEVDNWYQLYHSIKEELKQEKMYHRETDKLCDRYYIESQQAKRQVAKEIFEEIEKIIASHGITIGLVFDEAEGAAVAIGRIYRKIAELKKKYTEGGE